MTYLEILPLEEVKDFLHLEQDFVDQDAIIERMIKSALQFIENRTNKTIALRENVTYSNDSGEITIFDYPIRFNNPNNVSIHYKSGKAIVYAKEITADVGYLVGDDIPSDLITAALDLIEQDYFGAENKTGERIVSQKTMQIINSHRRFTVC